MSEGLSPLPILNTMLLAGVLMGTMTVTCSNSRLEERLIDQKKSIEDLRASQQPVDLSPVTDGMSRLEGRLASVEARIEEGVAVRTEPGAATDPATPVVVAKEPGAESSAVALGWGNRRARIRYVSDPSPDGVLTIDQKPMPQNGAYVSRQTSPPSSLNYYAANEGVTSTITGYTLQRMLGRDLDRPSEVEPSLATSWEIADDKLTYTFHLRKGVLFADGRPFTAQDVKFSFDVMRDPEVRAEHLRPSFDKVKSLEAVDDYTIVAKYESKIWNGLYSLGTTLRVLNKGWYEEQIPKFAKELEIENYSTTPGQPGFGEVFNKIRIPCPGTGPYYLASSDDATPTGVKFAQNPFYWGMQVHPTWWNFRTLRWKFIKDDIAAQEEFRKGAFDIFVVDHDTWADELSKDEIVAKMARHYVYDHVGLDCSYIAWNCRRPPFDDPKVRLAMTHLMDRQWILDTIERGNGTIAVCRTKRIYDTYSKDLVPHPFDIQKARELLTEAGWTDTNGDGVLDKNGQRFEFEFKIPNVRSFFKRVARTLEDACKKVGIRMTIRPLEWATFVEDIKSRNFDSLCLYNSWSDPWIDPYEQGWHSAHDVQDGLNYPGWRNDEVDAITEAHREEFDEQARVELFHRFNRLFHAEQPWTQLVHGQVGVLVNSRFENVKVRASGLNPADWWVKPENVKYE